MKIFKSKAFFLKSLLLHIFLIFVIAFVSISFWENPVFDAITNYTLDNSKSDDNISLVIIDIKLPFSFDSSFAGANFLNALKT